MNYFTKREDFQYGVKMCLITQVEGDSGHVKYAVVFAGMSRVEQGLLMSQFIPLPHFFIAVDICLKDSRAT